MFFFLILDSTTPHLLTKNEHLKEMENNERPKRITWLFHARGLEVPVCIYKTFSSHALPQMIPKIKWRADIPIVKHKMVTKELLPSKFHNPYSQFKRLKVIFWNLNSLASDIIIIEKFNDAWQQQINCQLHLWHHPLGIPY